jgi:hypothetical protein
MRLEDYRAALAERDAGYAVVATAQRKISGATDEARSPRSTAVAEGARCESGVGGERSRLKVHHQRKEAA